MPALPRGRARHDIARGVLNEVATLHHLIAPVPNIIGPAYGAKWCDHALKVLNAVDYLLTGIELALPIADAFDGNAPWRRPPPRSPSPRAALRERAGEPPIPEGADPGYRPRCRRPGPPLTAREHIRLGADLCRLRDGLTTAYVALANAYGVTHDLPRRARKASAALLKLRDKLDTKAHAELPARVGDRSTSSLYFGSGKVA